MSRIYDIILYGATGYTGKLAAKYVVQNCPTDLKWAVGGRSLNKLTAVVDDITPLNPNRKAPGIVIADSDDLEALKSLAKSTKVVVSLAGPFVKYGSKLVQACAENGTHYADITGESPWIRQIIQKHHQKPVSSPSIIIPSCGLDSIPSDMGTYILISALQNKYGQVKIKNVKSAVTEFRGGMSGGSIATSLSLMETFPIRDLVAAQKPFGLSPKKPANYSRQDPIVYDERLGGWIGPWLMGSTNSAVVCRTYGLLDGRWGDKFSYNEYYNYRGWFTAHAMQVALRVGGACLTLAPFRWLLKKILPSPGDGPTEDALNNGAFTMKIIAETDEADPKTGSITISTTQDAAYLLTAMMLVESGLTLAQDVMNTELWNIFFANGEKQSVVVTPSLLGETLMDKLKRGGMDFAVDV